MCWCLVVWLDVMDDPGKLGVSIPALLYKLMHSYMYLFCQMFYGQQMFACFLNGKAHMSMFNAILI